MKPVCISTWPFGMKANQKAWSILTQGGSALDAAEAGINAVELDPSVNSVGLGGLPNAEGEVELDAAIYWGPGRQVGAVAGLRKIAEAVSVARAVMERTPHRMLVGDSALWFALECGFRERDLLTPESRERWIKWKKEGGTFSHDTIGLCALDQEGNLCAATSTSGVAFKLPGRVGDSPLVGSGLYADNQVGSAVATGFGERIIPYCLALRVVLAMAEGLSPQEACEKVICWMVEDDAANLQWQMAVIALSREGEVGGASTKPGFSYALSNKEGTRLVSTPHWEELKKKQKEGS